MHICVSKLSIIGSDDGLWPGRRQAIYWTNAELLLIRTLGTNVNDILGEIKTFSLKKMYLKNIVWEIVANFLNVLSSKYYSLKYTPKELAIPCLNSDMSVKKCLS